MKVYVNVESLSIIKIEKEKPFYQGGNYKDYIRILFDSPPTNWSPVLTYFLPNGRTIGPKYPTGLENGETREVLELNDGKKYFYFDFYLSAKEGMLTIAGQLQMTLALNYVESDGSIIRKGIAATFTNTIVKTAVNDEGNIIIVGDNPNQIITDFINNLSILSQRQTTIEATWTNVVSKLVPVIKNLLVNSKDTYIEFSNNAIKIIHLGKTILEISDKNGLMIKTGGLVIDGEQDIRCGGDLIIDGTSRLKDVTFDNAHGETIVADDLRSIDGHIQDTLYVGDEIYLSDVEVKADIKDIRSKVQRLLNIIVDSMDSEDACICFTDNSITIEHKGQELVRISSDDGVYFYDTVEFRKPIEAKQGIYLKGESLSSILDGLKADYEEAKTYTYRKIEQEVKDRNAAIETLKRNLLDGAPQALDTLLELAKALGNDPNFATTITNLINQKFNESKAYADSNFIREENLPDLLANFTEEDLSAIFEGGVFIMNLIVLLKKVVTKIKENHYTKKETINLIDQKLESHVLTPIDKNSELEAKNLKISQNLSVKNLDMSYTAEDGITKKTGKVKSDVTPYTDETQNIGSSDKVWRGLYILSDGFKMRTKIPDPYRPGKFLTIKPFAIDSEGKLHIYFPAYGNHKAITIENDGSIVIHNPTTKQKIVSIMNSFFEIFGNQSTNSNEGQIQAFSLNTGLHRLDFSGTNAMLATAEEFSIIPNHGVFSENNVHMGDYDRIKFGGREFVYFDKVEDQNIAEDIIMCLKPATSDYEIVPFAITKTGIIYYKGEKLEELIARLSIPIYVKDSGDKRNITFAYSKAGLAFNMFDWLAAWNGNELRAISKNTFVSTVSNQNLDIVKQQQAKRNMGINGYLALDVVFDWSESEKNTAWNNYYLSIKNNTVSQPILYQWLESNTIYVVEICRRSLLKQSKYGNCGLVDEVFVISIPEYGGNEDYLVVSSRKTLSSGVELELYYDQDYETLDNDDGSTEDNWWAALYLRQYKNGTTLTGDNRLYEISKVYKFSKKW